MVPGENIQTSMVLEVNPGTFLLQGSSADHPIFLILNLFLLFCRYTNARRALLQQIKFSEVNRAELETLRDGRESLSLLCYHLRDHALAGLVYSLDF